MDQWNEGAPTFVSMRRASGLRADQSKNASKFGKVRQSMGRIQLAVTEADDPTNREMAVHMLEKRARRAMQLAGFNVSRTRRPKQQKFPRILETYIVAPLDVYFSDDGDEHLDALDMSADELVEARGIHREEQWLLRAERALAAQSVWKSMHAALRMSDILDERHPTIPESSEPEYVFHWWEQVEENTLPSDRD